MTIQAQVSAFGALLLFQAETDFVPFRGFSVSFSI